MVDKLVKKVLFSAIVFSLTSCMAFPTYRQGKVEAIDVKEKQVVNINLVYDGKLSGHPTLKPFYNRYLTKKAFQNIVKKEIIEVQKDYTPFKDISFEKKYDNTLNIRIDGMYDEKSCNIIAKFTLYIIPCKVRKEYKIYASLTNKEGEVVKTYVAGEGVNSYQGIIFLPFSFFLSDQKASRKARENLLLRTFNHFFKNNISLVTS